MRRITSSLSAALALATIAAQAQAQTPRVVSLGGEWAPKPPHQPKCGKPTKAEKKAAKRARRADAHGVRELPGTPAKDAPGEHARRIAELEPVMGLARAAAAAAAEARGNAGVDSPDGEQHG